MREAEKSEHWVYHLRSWPRPRSPSSWGKLRASCAARVRRVKPRLSHGQAAWPLLAHFLSCLKTARYETLLSSIISEIASPAAQLTAADTPSLGRDTQFPASEAVCGHGCDLWGAGAGPEQCLLAAGYSLTLPPPAADQFSSARFLKRVHEPKLLTVSDSI